MNTRLSPMAWVAIGLTVFGLLVAVLVVVSTQFDFSVLLNFSVVYLLFEGLGLALVFTVLRTQVEAGPEEVLVLKTVWFDRTTFRCIGPGGWHRLRPFEQVDTKVEVRNLSITVVVGKDPGEGYHVPIVTADGYTVMVALNAQADFDPRLFYPTYLLAKSHGYWDGDGGKKNGIQDLGSRWRGGGIGAMLGESAKILAEVARHFYLVPSSEQVSIFDRRAIAMMNGALQMVRLQNTSEEIDQRKAGGGPRHLNLATSFGIKLKVGPRVEQVFPGPDCSTINAAREQHAIARMRAQETAELLKAVFAVAQTLVPADQMGGLVRQFFQFMVESGRIGVSVNAEGFGNAFHNFMAQPGNGRD